MKSQYSVNIITSCVRKSINVNSTVIIKRCWIWITLSDRLIYTLQWWMQSITHWLLWSLIKFHLIPLHVPLWDRHSLCCSESFSWMSVTDRKSYCSSTSSHTRSVTHAHHKTERVKKLYWIISTILALQTSSEKTDPQNKKILILILKYLFYLHFYNWY